VDEKSPCLAPDLTRAAVSGSARPSGARRRRRLAVLAGVAV